MLRQIDAAFGRVWIASVKQRCVAHGSDAQAAAFVGDLSAKLGAFLAFRTEKAQLHQFVGTELLL